MVSNTIDFIEHNLEHYYYPFPFLLNFLLDVYQNIYLNNIATLIIQSDHLKLCSHHVYLILAICCKLTNKITLLP